MRENIENERRMLRAIVILSAAGALAVVGVIGWALYALWRVFA